jgi:hypothetical protein
MLGGLTFQLAPLLVHASENTRARFARRFHNHRFPRSSATGETCDHYFSKAGVEIGVETGVNTEADTEATDQTFAVS